MTNNYPTLDELLQMKAQIENSQRDAMIQNQNMNTVANMTQNLSPMGNLGIALGTIGGNLAARYFNNQWEKDLQRTRNAYQFNQFANGIRNYQPSSDLAQVQTDQLQILSPNVVNSLYAQRFPNQTPPNPALLATENNTATAPTNVAPSTSLFMKDTPSYDWRNQNYLSNNQPYFKPTYPDGTPKNYLTTYSAFR